MLRCGGAADPSRGENTAVNDFGPGGAERGELHQPALGAIFFHFFVALEGRLGRYSSNSITMCDRSSGLGSPRPASFSAALNGDGFMPGVPGAPWPTVQQ